MIKRGATSDPMDTTLVNAGVQKLKDALAIAPNLDSAYVDLGFAYALLKDPNTAVDMYRKATEINPSSANFKELADIYLRTGEADKALMAANAGLAKDAKSASLYNARGMALHDLTRFREAERDFRHALELDPTLVAARANLRALTAESSGSTITKKPASAAVTSASPPPAPPAPTAESASQSADTLPQPATAAPSLDIPGPPTFGPTDQ